jgi:hypothetical protein
MSLWADIDTSGERATNKGEALALVRNAQRAYGAFTAKEARSIALSPETAYALGVPTEVFGMGVIVRAEIEDSAA